MRYFGWLHPAATKRRMLVENLVGKLIVVREPLAPPPRWHLLSRVPTGTWRCPLCRQFTLVVIAKLRPARAPPGRGPTGPRPASPAIGAANGERVVIP